MFWIFIHSLSSIEQTHDNQGQLYDCELLPFMELGSVSHKYYLINVRLPVNEKKNINMKIGKLKNVRMVVMSLLCSDIKAYSDLALVFCN